MLHSGRSQVAQSTVEFGAAALVLILLLFGLIDLGRVFYFDVGLQGAVREGARHATWFDPQTGTNPFLYDTDGWSGAMAVLEAHRGRAPRCHGDVRTVRVSRGRIRKAR